MEKSNINEILRNLPQIDEVLKYGEIPSFRELLTADKIKLTVRRATDKIRARVLAGELQNADREALLGRIAHRAVKELKEEIRERSAKVINGTGVIIHTNLGRAPLSEKSANAVRELSDGYSNLEYSHHDGKRRSRLCHVEKLITDITGAEAAIVTNNNAAAVFLALNTVCAGKAAIVPRGEIVEIGDSFRISEIIVKSGAFLKEVGATNKVYLRDFENAIDESTGLLLKMHTSNFMVVGFTETVESAALTVLGKSHSLPVMEDMGSGVLFDLREIGLKYERTVQDAVKDGVDIITFSGDKMLGGPQAGIIAGKKQYIDAMRKNQLMRCLRVDKMCLIALEATLTQYLSKASVMEIPIYKMAAMDLETLEHRALRLKKMLDNRNLKIEIKPHEARFGGGSMPFETIESRAVYITCEYMSAATIDCFLRRSPTPVIGTIRNDEFLLDLRTISDCDFEYLGKILAEMTE